MRLIRKEEGNLRELSFDGGILAMGRGVLTGQEIKELNNKIYETSQKAKKILY